MIGKEYKQSSLTVSSPSVVRRAGAPTRAMSSSPSSRPRPFIIRGGVNWYVYDKDATTIDVKKRFKVTYFAHPRLDYVSKKSCIWRLYVWRGLGR